MKNEINYYNIDILWYQTYHLHKNKVPIEQTVCNTYLCIYMSITPIVLFDSISDQIMRIHMSYFG